MIPLDLSHRKAIHRHAAESMPSECCGVMLRTTHALEYVPCKNLAGRGAQFNMDPDDLMRAEDRGELLAVVHSHPYMPPIPSMADRVACNESGLPWLIVGYPTLVEHWLYPDKGFELPYVGRQFAYGVLDCYTLVADYYRRELGIALPNRLADKMAQEDESDWWLKGKDLYSRRRWLDNGFELVETPKLHDIHVIQVRSPVGNHLAVQCEEQLILHHLQNKLSGKTLYGGFWQKNTLYTLRHKSVL